MNKELIRSTIYMAIFSLILFPIFKTIDEDKFDSSLMKRFSIMAFGVTIWYLILNYINYTELGNSIRLTINKIMEKKEVIVLIPLMVFSVLNSPKYHCDLTTLMSIENEDDKKYLINYKNEFLYKWQSFFDMLIMTFLYHERISAVLTFFFGIKSYLGFLICMYISKKLLKMEEEDKKENKIIEEGENINGIR